MKKLSALSAGYALLLCFLLTACEKKEQAVVLPPTGPAEPGTITMGESYEQQVFFDFESNKVVYTSETTGWDLSFEAATDGNHVFMNGGKGVFLYNTHQQEFGSVTSLPAGLNKNTLLFDDPSGIPDSTATRNWRDASGKSRKEVFIAKLDDTTYYKFVLLAVSDDHYEMQYGRLKDVQPVTITVPKNVDYNFSYFSFTKGLVNSEPPKASWDVVFTRYCYIYRDLDNFPYEVNGVLLNPFKVSAAPDSTHRFDEITFEHASGLMYSTHRDVIGSDWKTYNFTSAHYDVNKNKCYVVNTRNGKVFKLHFLNFYSNTGVKGSPSFESQQLQ